VQVTDAEILETEGTHMALPPLPYDSKGDRAPGVVIGSDDRSFPPWAYPYSTIGQTDRGCTATVVGRMVTVMAAHCVQTVRAKSLRQAFSRLDPPSSRRAPGGIEPAFQSIAAWGRMNSPG